MAHPGQIISMNADLESKFGLSYKHAGAAMPAATGVGVAGSTFPVPCSKPTRPRFLTEEKGVSSCPSTKLSLTFRVPTLPS